MERKFVLIIETVLLLGSIAIFAFYYRSLIFIGIALGVMLVIVSERLAHAQLSMSIYYCPNPLCPYAEKLEKEKKCPMCGTKARKFGVRQSLDLLKEKHKVRDTTDRTRVRGRL